MPRPDLARFNQLLPRPVGGPDDRRYPLLPKANLKQLKLPTMLAEHDSLAREAADRDEPYDGDLLRLTELEVAARTAIATTPSRNRAGSP